MNLQEMKARLTEIAALLAQFNDGRQLEQTDLDQTDVLNVEFETLCAQIETKEKIEANLARANGGVRKSTPAPVAAAPTPAQASITAGADRLSLDPKRGFKSQGEFYSSVISLGKGGRVDERFIKGALMERGSEDGGIFVPEDFRTDVLEKIQGPESLLPLTTQFRTASNSVTLPIFEQAPWDSTQGIQIYWTEEAGLIRDSQPKFGSFQMRLHKLAAMVKITDELMEDAPLLETWIKAQVPKAIVSKINQALIRGTGAGMPQGFLNSPFRINVAKESGQVADSIVFANINKMLGSLTPNSIGRARWLVNPAILPLLRTMKFDETSTQPIPVYMPSTGVSGAPYGTLFGIPILPQMAGMSAVGDSGDIILVDMSYVYSAVKTAGVQTAMSTHVYFDYDMTALRFTQRIAAGVPYKSPITNDVGDYTASGIVTVADRA